MNRLSLIHTSATLIPMFSELCAQHLPSETVNHVSDESLIKEVIREGKVTPSVVRRVAAQVVCASDAGADRIMVTCSSIGAAVEHAAALVDKPVLRVDQPMADAAVRIGGTIGVAATLPTTLQPTADLIRRRAEQAGASIRLNERLCAGAFDALMAGDARSHDRSVRDALTELREQCDVVVLAQASMARVAEQTQGSSHATPILSSPELAIRHLAELD